MPNPHTWSLSPDLNAAVQATLGEWTIPTEYAISGAKALSVSLDDN